MFRGPRLSEAETGKQKGGKQKGGTLHLIRQGTKAETRSAPGKKIRLTLNITRTQAYYRMWPAPRAKATRLFGKFAPLARTSRPVAGRFRSHLCPVSINNRSVSVVLCRFRSVLVDFRRFRSVSVGFVSLLWSFFPPRKYVSHRRPMSYVPQPSYKTSFFLTHPYGG